MQFSCSGCRPASRNSPTMVFRRSQRLSRIWSSGGRPSRTFQLMMRIIFVPRRFMRGIARRVCSRSFSKSASLSIDLPQLAMAEPKQFTCTPASSSAAAARSNASSERSWMFTPSMQRDSMLLHPSSLVAAIWPARSRAASSAKPVRYMACFRSFWMREGKGSFCPATGRDRTERESTTSAPAPQSQRRGRPCARGRGLLECAA